MGSHAGTYSWLSSLGRDFPPPGETTISIRSKQASDQGYQLDDWGLWVSPKGKLWLREALQWKILKTLHQLYHLGLDNTLVLVNKMFGGTKLRDTAQQVVQACETYQKISNNKTLQVTRAETGILSWGILAIRL
jgi:hypothetical protein